MLSKAKFNLRVWASNTQLLMATTQQDGEADENQLTNVLGVQMGKNHERTMPYQWSINHQTGGTPGLLQTLWPTVRAKLLMQQLWQWGRGITWDEPLDQDLLEEWTTTLTDICKSAGSQILHYSLHRAWYGATCICRCQHQGLWSSCLHLPSKAESICHSQGMCCPTETGNPTEIGINGCCNSY